MAFKLLHIAQQRWRRLDGAASCLWSVPASSSAMEFDSIQSNPLPRQLTISRNVSTK